MLREERPTQLVVTLIGADDLHARLDTDEHPDTLAVLIICSDACIIIASRCKRILWLCMYTRDWGWWRRRGRQNDGQKAGIAREEERETDGQTDRQTDRACLMQFHINAHDGPFDFGTTFQVVSVDGRKMLAEAGKGESNPRWQQEFIFDALRPESNVHITLFDRLCMCSACTYLRSPFDFQAACIKDRMREYVWCDGKLVTPLYLPEVILSTDGHMKKQHADAAAAIPGED